MGERGERLTPCDVVGVGANSVDYVTRIPAWPSPSGPFSKLRIQEQIVSCGGQTTTALATCVRLGLSACYMGATGDDENGARIRAELARRGIDLSSAVIRDAPNPFAIILLEPHSGERIVLWHRDERLRLAHDEVSSDVIRTARLVHVDDADEGAAIVAARLGREMGKPVTSDIDRVTPATTELVETVSYPIFAEHVPHQLTGISDPEEALLALRRPAHAALAVTLGSKGAIAVAGDRVIRSSGYAVRAVDTTGAGDVFRGAFIFGILNDWPLERTMQFANAAAAVSCTRTGAISAVPSLPEASALVESSFT